MNGEEVRSTVHRIGILALQGAFAEHQVILAELGIATEQVRVPDQLKDLDGLIIPGGESTTIGKLAVQYGLVEPLKRFAASGRPMWGICAGLIFMAKDIGGSEQPLLGVMDITVRRNAFGRQVDSFEIDLEVPGLVPPARNTDHNHHFHAVFIRGPLITSVGEGVQVLARLPDHGIVAARQGNLIVTAFHPELSGDPRFHQYFLSMSAQIEAAPMSA